VAQLIEGYAPVIELIGGAMLVYFGWRSFFAPPMVRCLDEEGNDGASNLIRAIVSTFLLTITNPATLLAFTAMFAGLGGLAGGAGSYVDAGFVVAGVVGGSAGWWLALTTLIGLFHAKIDEKAMKRINRVSGLLVGIFGLVVLVHLVLKFA
jgi:threonine/homoserine/homoserine lactone efflux protein